ncbi:hypothetical protein GINT2_000109 [Glugoides intestinalis]
MSKFWKTQPVERGESLGIINNTVNAETSQTPLPEGFKWATVKSIESIVKFLNEYYVEDSASAYRLSYYNEFFNFLFTFPKHKSEYSLGLFKGDTMIGYIMAREHEMSLRNKVYRLVSANFLCLSKEYRNRNFTPLLIREITRIANLNEIFQAIFTAEKELGFSICKAIYYHYPMNATRLLKAEFIDSVNDVKPILTCREGTKLVNDPSVFNEIYDKMISKFALHEKFSPDTFRHVFIGMPNVFYSLYNESTSEFASFYLVDTKCLSSDMLIKRAYLYYWAGTPQIIQDAIAISNKLGADMFDAVDIADNITVLKRNRFVEGTGTLRYHIYNIKEETIPGELFNFLLF